MVVASTERASGTRPLQLHDLILNPSVPLGDQKMLSAYSETSFFHFVRKNYTTWGDAHMVDVQFSHYKTQVLSEHGMCNTPTQKPAVREPQSWLPRYVSHFRGWEWMTETTLDTQGRGLGSRTTPHTQVSTVVVAIISPNSVLFCPHCNILHFPNSHLHI